LETKLAASCLVKQAKKTKKEKEKKKNPPSISHRSQAYPSVSVSPRATKR